MTKELLLKLWQRSNLMPIAKLLTKFNRYLEFLPTPLRESAHGSYYKLLYARKILYVQRYLDLLIDLVFLWLLSKNYISHSTNH